MMFNTLKLKSLVGAALMGAAILAASGTHAQTYPDHRITLVVPQPAGATSDALARILAERLSVKERLGQPVIVENKPGAGTYIGHDFVAKAAPDGYTLLLGTVPLITPKAMYMVEGFDANKLVSLGRIAGSPFLVLVPVELGVNTFPELIAMARNNPGKLNYAVLPNSTMQLDLLQFTQVTKTNMTEIPFNGAAPMVTALLGNQVQVGFLSSSALPHIQSGKLKALAVTSKTRWSRMPQVPSMGDLGIDYESNFWSGLCVPAGTPQPIIDRISRELAAIYRQPELREAIVKLGMDPIEPNASEMAQTIQRERALAEAMYKLLQARTTK